MQTSRSVVAHFPADYTTRPVPGDVPARWAVKAAVDIWPNWTTTSSIGTAHNSQAIRFADDFDERRETNRCVSQFWFPLAGVEV